MNPNQVRIFDMQRYHRQSFKTGKGESLIYISQEQPLQMGFH